MEPLYNIYFAGEVMEGQDPVAVREALGKLFRADVATLDRLFSGEAQAVKRNCDKATALKYKQAMEKAGARPLIKRAESPVQRAEPPAESRLTAAERIAALAAAPDMGSYQEASAGEPEEQTSAASDDDDFDLAAAGADVLRPEERAAPVIANIETSHLEVDAAASRLSDEAPPPPQAPDTSHLSMGEVGEDIPVLDTGVEPLSPDTDALALSPEERSWGS